MRGHTVTAFHRINPHLRGSGCPKKNVRAALAATKKIQERILCSCFDVMI
jgi:hypothetical protein